MKFKKKKKDEGKKQEDGIRERVEELQKEEAKARRAERPKYLPDKRNVIVIITGVLCFLIVAGGIYMVSRIRKDNEYNANGLVQNSSESTVESVSSSSSETSSSTISDRTEESSSSAVETQEPVGITPGYHPIKRPEVPSSTANSSENEAASNPGNSRDPESSTSPNSSISSGNSRGPESSFSDVTQSESSSLGVENIDVGTLFH